jgi:hypothetical protein
VKGRCTTARRANSAARHPKDPDWQSELPIFRRDAADFIGTSSGPGQDPDEQARPIREGEVEAHRPAKRKDG